MQQEIPRDLLSRLSSFDAIGSFALAPVGVAAAGPLAATFGISTVLAAGGVLIVLLTLAVLLVPEVRQLRRRTPESGLRSQDDPAAALAGAGAKARTAEPG